ncbi:MAG: hypothetical protein HY043_20895 [Verrucomicrobia bacterium]|nr:hypothetical protein [Verrucomicrobiota bacterium]
MANQVSTFDPAAFKQLLATPTLPDLGPGPRAGVERLDALQQRLNTFFAKCRCAPARRELLRGAALLWHDHHDAAHEFAQRDASAEGSFLHGILHRREPDYANARYWFHRVGHHPCFGVIAEKVAELIADNPDREPEIELLPRGHWDPFAFIDACEAAALLPLADPRRKLLQEIQAIEFDALVEHLGRHSQG